MQPERQGQINTALVYPCTYTVLLSLLFTCISFVNSLHLSEHFDIGANM